MFFSCQLLVVLGQKELDGAVEDSFALVIGTARSVVDVRINAMLLTFIAFLTVDHMTARQTDACRLEGEDSNS